MSVVFDTENLTLTDNYWKQFGCFRYLVLPAAAFRTEMFS